MSAARPVVDVRSAEIGFNFKDDVLNSLPLERTYRGLFQLIPGVADNRSPVGPAAGGSRQDNLYLIDGANITSPAFGYLSTEVNELDIAEVNIKRGGINAEFGRTTGSVVNAVSRSGTNRFSGIGRVDWLSEQLVGGYDLPEDLVNASVRPGTFRDTLLTSETNLDLMTAYRLPLDGTSANVSIEARLLNVFNNQTRLSTDSQKYLDLQTVPAAPYFAPYQQPNPFFGMGNGFAPPRRLHLAAVVSF